MKRFVRCSRLPISLLAALCFAFALSPVRAQYTNLHEFTGVSDDGSVPIGSPTSSGTTLYGVATGGGVSSKGVVFKMNVNGSGYTNLHEFAGGSGDGDTPIGTLVLSGTTLYGMTRYGGAASGAGVVFKMGTDGSGYTNLHKFAGGTSDGANPYDSLTLSGTTLYGMTSKGGTSDNGVVFKVNTDGGGYTNLHEFAGGSGDGAGPDGSLVLSGTTLYGMARFGGASNKGVVFKVGTDGGGYTNLHEFAGGSGDGANAYSSLNLNGTTLYGVTEHGGVSNAGVVFAYSLIPTAPLTVTKLQTKLNFAKGTNDSCSLSATLDLGAGYDLTNKFVALDVGGATNVTFTLDAKGKGKSLKNSFGSCKLAYNRATHLYALSAKMVKGSWQTEWADYSMVNSNVPKPGILITNFPVTVTLDATNYAGLATNLHYTAKASKSGTAK